MKINEILNETTIKLSGFGPSEKTKEWVAKVNSQFQQSPLNPNYRIMMFGQGNDMQIVQFELVPKQQNKVELKWIQATPLRSGAGSKAMKILQDLAQQDGIKLTLYAWDKGQISQAKLMKFYKKHGFSRLGKTGNMEWEPINEVDTISHSKDDDKFWDYETKKRFKDLSDNGKLKEAGTINGLKMMVGPYGYSDAYFFMDGDSPVGLAMVVKKYDPEYRTISMFYLDPRYRRQGTAFNFYKMLLQNYNLMSDKIQTFAMQEVWKKLGNLPGYNTKQVGDRYLIVKEPQNAEQLDESLSRIVYHYTTVGPASKILTSGEFELSSSLGSIEAQYSPKGYHYFLSTTRSSRGGYHDVIGQSAVLFVMNGNYYNQKYPSKPVDYWNNRNPEKAFGRTHEAEDRLFSKEPTIPINGVTAVHIFAAADADHNVKALARKSLLEAKKRGIPSYYYNDKAAWKKLDTTKAVSPSDLSGQQRIGGYRRHRGWLIPWLEVMQATNKSQLSSKAKQIVRSISFKYYGDHYRKEAGQGLATDLSNARKPDSGADRQNAIKIINYMRKNKLNTLADFVNAMGKKWDALDNS